MNEITHTAGLLEYAGCIADRPTAIMSGTRQIAAVQRTGNAYGDGVSWEEAHHNAQRLAACWNACNGIDTADLARMREALEWIVEGYEAGEGMRGPKMAHGIAEALSLLRPSVAA